jgi:SAM-dependent methyltransferase
MLDIAYLNLLRRAEMEAVLPMLPPGSRILEFGSGTGEQARFLTEHGFEVTAIDLATSNYAHDRLFPVQDYDGHQIPLPDRSVDVIFSSNVLEHVDNFDEISAEFRRILKPGGFAIHVVPTTAWRFWTFLSGAAESLKAAICLPAWFYRRSASGEVKDGLVRQLRRIASGFVPRGHGTSAEGISELWSFSRIVWRRKFRRSGFEVIEDRPIGLFYTGTSFFGDRLPVARRRSMARIMGSSTRMYLIRPPVPKPALNG